MSGVWCLVSGASVWWVVSVCESPVRVSGVRLWASGESVWCLFVSVWWVLVTLLHQCPKKLTRTLSQCASSILKMKRCGWASHQCPKKLASTEPQSGSCQCPLLQLLVCAPSERVCVMWMSLSQYILKMMKKPVFLFVLKVSDCVCVGVTWMSKTICPVVQGLCNLKQECTGHIDSRC